MIAPKAVVQLFHEQTQLVIVSLVTDRTPRPTIMLVVMLVVAIVRAVMLAAMLALKPTPLLFGGWYRP